MHASIVDLQYMHPETIVGREQIRETLVEGFHVPVEVTSWFFEMIEEREKELQKLRREQIFLDMAREQ